MAFKKSNNLDYWGWISLGALFSFFGAREILTGESYLYHGDVIIHAWYGWVELHAGIWILFLSIRALWRNKKNPESESARNLTLDEEAAHAEAQLDAMYLREHGEPPQKPNKDPHAEDTNASE